MILHNLLTTFLLLVWQVVPYINARVDRDGHKPNYLKVGIARVFAGVTYWFFWTKYPEDGWLLFWVTIYELTSFYLVFEILLNIWRKRPILHYDYIENDSGWIDGFFGKLYRKFKTHLFHHAFKLLCLIAVIVSITKIYELHIVR